ncbi:MAG: NAD(P)H-hydrate dehydratase [Bacteroidota bacterium]
MQILNAEQIRAADQHTIKNEPIASIDLMERASEAFVSKFVEHYTMDKAVAVFSGQGNNGGDGLAIARLLYERGYTVGIWVVGTQGKGTPDFIANYDRLPITAHHIEGQEDLPDLAGFDIVIDGLFGSGLNRPLEGLPAMVVRFLNRSGCRIVAVDIASGLYLDQPVPEASPVIEPERTITFQVPKLAFFQPQIASFVGDWDVVDIGLDREFLSAQSSAFRLTEKSVMQQFLPERKKFMHKGDAGRVALWTGSQKKMGAALLSAQSCLRSGAGLLWMLIPEQGQTALNIKIPEAMTTDHDQLLDEAFGSTLDVLGVGPGIGTDEGTLDAFERLLARWKKPMVLDADAITLLSYHPKLQKQLPKDSILTPHPGEFRRLVGDWSDDYDKLRRLQTYCRNFEVCVVLKGAFSAVCDSEGQIFFNPTGNAGMATAGTGDVLFGMICGLLAQGLASIAALRLGVYLHGMSGDLAKDQFTEYSLLATDIIRYLPNSFVGLSK